MFDPVRLLDSLGIEYTTKRDNVYLQCPWCQDEGRDNFGIRIDGTRWGCWRVRSHGGPLARVVRAITGWNVRQVEEYLQDQEGAHSAAPMAEIRRRIDALGTRPKPQASADIVFPPEFRVPCGTGITRRFHAYLKARGLPNVDRVVRDYSIRCAVSGEWRDRLILPVFDGDHLVGWTGRAIGKAELRYRAEPQGHTIKEYLFSGPDRDARFLIIVEGPLDVIPLADACRTLGVDVVGTMGTDVTDAQLTRLSDRGGRCERTAILFDRGADVAARLLQRSLPTVRPLVARLPHHRKDPGELLPAEARALVRSVFSL